MKQGKLNLNDRNNIDNFITINELAEYYNWQSQTFRYLAKRKNMYRAFGESVAKEYERRYLAECKTKGEA